MKTILVLIFLISGCASGQQLIEGYAYDAKTKEPLMGAAVYYEGTTLGTITNDRGKFILDITERSTSKIVVSYLGYQDQIITYRSDIVKVYLKPKLESLGEVIIQGNLPFSREEMIQAFKQQFLGQTTAGRSCTIANEDALYFYYDTDTNSLIANADESLIVENTYLGYEIRYTLYKFQVDFYRKSISPKDEKQSYFAGTSFYRDVRPRIKKYKRRRRRTYRGSTLELMRTIAKEDFGSKPYTFFKKGVVVDPFDIFTVTNEKGLKKVYFKDEVGITHSDNERSSMRQLTEYFTIDGYGNHKANSLIFKGTMGFERLGDALPLDYGL